MTIFLVYAATTTWESKNLWVIVETTLYPNDYTRIRKCKLLDVALDIMMIMTAVF